MARPKVSLNEVMGKGAAKSLSLDNIAEVLGEKMPRLPLNNVGKVRLIQALRNRYGASYRNLPGVSSMLAEFDERVEHDNRLEQMKRIKLKTVR